MVLWTVTEEKPTHAPRVPESIPARSPPEGGSKEAGDQWGTEEGEQEDIA